jgi:DivIVA domain-containing protein
LVAGARPATESSTQGETVMTAEDIRSQNFNIQLLGGLSRREVSAFVADVAEAYERLQTVNLALRERTKELEAEVQSSSGAPVSPVPSGHVEMFRGAALREIEALLHEAQGEARAIVEGAKEQEATLLRDAEAARARLQAEGDSLVAEATARADSLLAAARSQEAAIRSEIDRLTESRLQLIDGIRGTLNAYEQWLTTMDPRAPRRDWRDVQLSNGDHGAVESSEEARVG